MRLQVQLDLGQAKHADDAPPARPPRKDVGVKRAVFAGELQSSLEHPLRFAQLTFGRRVVASPRDCTAEKNRAWVLEGVGLKFQNQMEF